MSWPRLACFLTCAVVLLGTPGPIDAAPGVQPGWVADGPRWAGRCPRPHPPGRPDVSLERVEVVLVLLGFPDHPAGLDQIDNGELDAAYAEQMDAASALFRWSLGIEVDVRPRVGRLAMPAPFGTHPDAQALAGTAWSLLRTGGPDLNPEARGEGATYRVTSFLYALDPGTPPAVADPEPALKGYFVGTYGEVLADAALVEDPALRAVGQRAFAHELGHALGLGHTHRGPSDVMNDRTLYGPTALALTVDSAALLCGAAGDAP